MHLDPTVVNIWRSSLCLLAQAQTHAVKEGCRWMVVRSGKVKKRRGVGEGGAAKCVPGGMASVPRGGARLCFLRDPEDVPKTAAVFK